MEKKPMTKDEFNAIMQKHDLWLAGDPKGQRASFKEKNLSKLSIINRNLRCVDFSEAECVGTKFINCWLDNADFEDANLTSAEFYTCSALDVVFTDANLTSAYFAGTNLKTMAVSGANLKDVQFKDCFLLRVWFDTAENVPENVMPIVCPEVGSFRAFKKVIYPVFPFHTGNRAWKSAVAEIEIPEHAKRTSATTNKCRCSEAKVIRYWTLDHKPLNIHVTHSQHDADFTYVKGATVKPEEEFDTNRWEECTSGIHFFLTFDSAANY